MSGHRGKLVALAATATMGELFAECKQQAETSPTELQEILEEMHVYLIQQAAVKLDDILIDIEQLKLDKEAKSSLLYKSKRAGQTARQAKNKQNVDSQTDYKS